MSVAILTPVPRAAVPREERLLKAADLVAFPTSLATGDVKYELDQGRLVVLAPPGHIHSRGQAKIVRYLDTEAEERGLGEVCAEVSIILRRDPDRVVAPDAAFILKESLPARRSKEGYLETIPEIVVEVRSKNDTFDEILSKSQEYFDAGVKLVWVLDPSNKTVTARQSEGGIEVFGVSDVLSTTLLPGFAVPLARLFQAL